MILLHHTREAGGSKRVNRPHTRYFSSHPPRSGYDKCCYALVGPSSHMLEAEKRFHEESALGGPKCFERGAHLLV